MPPIPGALFATGELCAGAGLPLYEISNHARPGAESRHNLQYWAYGDYAGVGVHNDFLFWIIAITTQQDIVA